MALAQVQELDRHALSREIDLIKQIKERERYNAIELYDPYPFQLRFHETSKDASQRVLCAGNRVGKTKSGASETCFHLTGLYPPWWKFRKYKDPIVAWVGGVSTETCRDIAQAELLGRPGDPEALGTGAIPRSCIIETQRKPGVPNAVAMAIIRHVSGGNSYVYFKAFNQWNEPWMGSAVDVVWLDEEPPREIYTQGVTRTLASKQGGMCFMTYTPESGMSETTSQFFTDLRPGQSLSHGSWDDASESITTTQKKVPGHLTEAAMEQLLQALPPHEREMRKYGRPTIGSGLVFPIPEEKLLCEPFVIPEHFERIAGIDFGYDHPTAVCWCALDPDEDIIYVYDVYRRAKMSPEQHSIAISTRGNWPIAWPHDGNRLDSMGNPSLRDQYVGHGLNLLPSHFTNPPAVGEKKGGNSIEAGIMDMLQRMEQDRFKVFSTLGDWFEEFRLYHRKAGTDGKVKIVPIKDDLMSATRYAVMSVRFAVPEGDSPWKGDLRYPDLGIV